MYRGMNKEDEWVYAYYLAAQPRGDDRWQDIVNHMIGEIETYLAFYAEVRKGF